MRHCSSPALMVPSLAATMHYHTSHRLRISVAWRIMRAGHGQHLGCCAGEVNNGVLRQSRGTAGLEGSRRPSYKRGAWPVQRLVRETQECGAGREAKAKYLGLFRTTSRVALEQMPNPLLTWAMKVALPRRV